MREKKIEASGGDRGREGVRWQRRCHWAGLGLALMRC